MSLNDKKNLEAVAFNRLQYTDKQACIDHLKCEYCGADHYDSICCCTGNFTCMQCQRENCVTGIKMDFKVLKNLNYSLPCSGQNYEFK